MRPPQSAPEPHGEPPQAIGRARAGYEAATARGGLCACYALLSFPAGFCRRTQGQG